MNIHVSQSFPRKIKKNFDQCLRTVISKVSQHVFQLKIRA